MNTQGKYKCEYCNEAEFDTLQQLRGHQMKCRPKNKEERQERVPFGSPQRRFKPSPDDGYHYRVFNDNWRKEPGRIQRARAAGYEVVDDPMSGGTVGTNDDGTEIKGVLMRIPQELYDEDQAKKNRELDKIDEQIYGGKFQDRPENKRYVPSSGIRVETKLTP
ncbi:MAG: hypothetical protein JRI72_00510 [Deltaproteobacteria bacterium]|nr:hypothetical protein [Deltaproteobacteria bacterium]